MKIKILIPSLLLLSFVLSFGQSNTNNVFKKFADKQNDLMVAAYEKRDTTQYLALLKEFIQRYDTLNAADKTYFKGYYSNAYYNLACTFSLLQKKKEALDNLEKSVNLGLFDYAHIIKDPDLEPVRNEQKFKDITAKIRGIGDYLYILRRSDKYNTQEIRELPNFTYQASSDEHLAELRKAFNLDSVAGGGNEVSKFLSLMHWVHNLIPHDGNKGIPAVRNAMAMINYCKSQNKTLNCRGLAILLNECYLAMGYKSRFVTCLPKDSLGIDSDCHVIDMVYSNSMKKWLWIDPTFDNYVMNEKGELLGIEEVRQKIINGEPLIMNPEANWNHKNSETKDHYLGYYMVKNLYMLECPVNSQYNLETKEEGKIVNYIRLVPLDYFKQTPEVETIENKEMNSKVVKYKTNNPAVFWAPPN